jgi:hypothetical protein
MAAIRDLLEDIRGEQAPTLVYVPTQTESA